MEASISFIVLFIIPIPVSDSVGSNHPSESRTACFGRYFNSSGTYFSIAPANDSYSHPSYSDAAIPKAIQIKHACPSFIICFVLCKRLIFSCLLNSFILLVFLLVKYGFAALPLYSPHIEALIPMRILSHG